MDWIDQLDSEQAINNLMLEKNGDWYRDPWNWPEYRFLRSPAGAALIRDHLLTNAPVSRPSEIDVPKENFGIRPAVILPIMDRFCYQALVDAASKDLIGNLIPDVFGWRLPLKMRRKGQYARQDFQWAQYRSKLSQMADVFDYGLKTDITSFFASLDPELVAASVTAFGTSGPIADKLSRMLLGWKSHNPRPGLPQRSTASAVLANMVLQNIDSTLQSLARPIPTPYGVSQERTSYTRWMDDIWIFDDDNSALRSAQVDLQLVLKQDGLVINAAKTKLLAGNALIEAAKKIESSAIDDALSGTPTDHTPLEELINRLFDELEATDRSTVRFVSSRMREHNVTYRLDDLLGIAEQIPHAADHFSRLFRQLVPSSIMQDWMLDYVGGKWSHFEWTTAQFATTISSRRRPRRTTRELFVSLLERPNISVPLAAVTSQKLASWDPNTAREVIAEIIKNEDRPQVVRVLALASLQAHTKPEVVRRWLREHDENRVSYLAMEQLGYKPPAVSKDFL